MNLPVTPAQQTTPAATPPTSAAPERPSLSQRAAAVKERLEAPEPTEATVGEPTTEAAPPEPAQSTPVDDAAARARAERLERLKQVRAKELAREQERQKNERYRAAEGELEKLRAKLAEYEPLNSVFTSEESLLAEAERRGLSPQKLVEWMRTRLTDPQAVAQRQAQTVEEKLKAELAKRDEAIETLRREMQERERAAAEEAQLRSKTDNFIGGVEHRASANPLTAAFLRRHGPERLVLYANRHVAPDLPEDYTLDELYDHLEQHLEETQLGPLGPPPANGASHGASHQAKSGAAEPVNTLSNAVVSGRESLVESVPLHKLSREERKRRLREMLERE